MAFFVYIAILLVSISGILLELDWLTKPKLETRQPVQAASTAVPQTVPRAKPRADGPNPDLSPVYPKKDPPRAIEQVIAAPQPMQSAQPAPDTAAGAPTAPPSAVATNSRAPAPQKPAETTGAATAADQTAPMPPAQMAGAPAQNASAAAAPNKCDVQACSSAYASFRATDCTYQPFEGPRRVCEKAPETGRKVASQPREARDGTVARRRSRDAELRDVERSVRQITEQRADADDDVDFDDRRISGRRIIVIDRPSRW